MSKDRQNNIYDRHQNKRALAKKERAKARHFGKEDSFNESFDEEEISWNSIEKDFEREIEVLGTLVETRGGIFLFFMKKIFLNVYWIKKFLFNLERVLLSEIRCTLKLKTGREL
ncbi:MAG: hypothetical protein ACTFAK_01270 [Candidatus Electronema sp. VV]